MGYRHRKTADNPERVVFTDFNDPAAYAILTGVMGQLSDGMWENSPAMNGYWMFANIDDNCNIVIDDVGGRYTPWSGSGWVNNKFYGKSDDEVRKFFANKVKAVCKEWLSYYSSLGWSRDNDQDEVDYFHSINGGRTDYPTIRDAYRIYDSLLGRIERIPVVSYMTWSDDPHWWDDNGDDFEDEFYDIVDSFRKLLGTAYSNGEIGDAYYNDDLDSYAVDALSHFGYLPNDEAVSRIELEILGDDLSRYASRKVADWREEDTEPAGENAEEAFDNLVEKLQDTSFEDLGDELNDICNDDKLHALLEEGFGDGDFANVHMSTSATSINVQQLLPCQNEIGLGNSLDFGLDGRFDVRNYFDDPVTIKAPIVTYMGNFIIDGHHRWSQVYMFNPHADISAINFSYSEGSPWRALRNFQGAIAVAEGEVPSSAADVANVYVMDESSIRDHIESKMVDACVDGLSDCVDEVDDWESAVQYLLANIDMLKSDNYPIANAPDRDAMPQTTPEAIDVMEEGQTNI